MDWLYEFAAPPPEPPSAPLFTPVGSSLSEPPPPPPIAINESKILFSPLLPLLEINVAPLPPFPTVTVLTPVVTA